MKRLSILLWLLAPVILQARVVQMKIERREPVLAGKAFGAAGAYEKLVGRVEFALDPKLEKNLGVIDLNLAPKNARGEVEFSAEFYLLKPVDISKANGRLLYEVGNRGGKAMLVTFQKASGSGDPRTQAEFGDGFLMRDGYSLLWMGWQWDVPDGRMRMDMPIATDHDAAITGLLRGNFIPDTRSATGPLADRGHKAYPVADRNSADAFMTVRDATANAPQKIARDKWHFIDDNTVQLDDGFEPGRIYDVVYRAKDPRVLGTDLTGTRDLISFLKNATDGNPLRGTVKFAYGWGVSQSGRLLRHLLYEGFNEDEAGRKVFDGVIDEVGGAGRGSFNHRFGQASRDAEQFFNFLYPVDMFPFTDGPETDPETGETGSLLGAAEKRGVTPKMFHILSNSEYFNRAGALVHSDPAGKTDIAIPGSVRIYTIASGPHFIGPFPPAATAANLAAPLNPLNRNLVMRALLKAMDAWVVEGAEPPVSQYPKIADGTLVARASAGWPKIPGVLFPPPALVTYRLDFGPKFAKEGVVEFEPPHIGKPYAVLVPAVDADGNARAGIRMPAIEAPIATYSGWNYRARGSGAEDQFAGEAGSFFPFARSRAERTASGDSRLSMEERYSSREQYVGKVALAAQKLVQQRYMLAEDVTDSLAFAALQWDWAMPAAQAEFVAGLRQLHNFEYADAAAHFREAQHIDPGFAMALWGEAMTFNHPVWHQQDLAGARDVLGRLRRLGKASTEREELYIAAIETLYGEGALDERNSRYERAMAELYRRYPADIDAASLYALAILGTSREGRDYATYMRAAAVLEEVFPEHPQHPGVVHYLIHCYDDSVHAPLGLRAARIYAQIAPDAGHAQHMTSHIFLELGQWEETAKANENAAVVVNRGREKEGRPARWCGHYNFWLQYSYLQLGRVDDARRVLDGCRREAEAMGTNQAAMYMLDPDDTATGSWAQMRANFLIDSRLWNDEVVRQALPHGANAAAAFTYEYAGALAALMSNGAGAQDAKGRVEASAKALEALLTGEHNPAGVENLARSRVRILTRQVQALELAGEGKNDAAVRLLAEAAHDEEAMPREFGPPFVDKPTGELLGELLLKLNKRDEAAKYFRAELERAPGRRRSVEGLSGQ